METTREFHSLLKGKYEGYPEKIHASLFKVHHWRSLFACNGNKKMIDDVLTQCFDDVLDLERTGIKSSTELTSPDRLYFFIQQRIFSGVGDNFSIFWTCHECGEKNPEDMTFDVYTENYLKEEMKKKELNYKINDVSIILSLPTNKKENEFNEFTKDYLTSEENSDFVQDINNGDRIALEIMTAILYIDNFNELGFKDLGQFIEWFDDLSMGEYTKLFDEIKDYKEKLQHGFESKRQAKCPKCGYEYEQEVLQEITFFLTFR